MDVTPEFAVNIHLGILDKFRFSLSIYILYNLKIGIFSSESRNVFENYHLKKIKRHF